MYARALVRHRDSGEVFVALADEDNERGDVIVSISHPLHWSEWSYDGGLSPMALTLNDFDLNELDEPEDFDDYTVIP